MVNAKKPGPRDKFVYASDDVQFNNANRTAELMREAEEKRKQEKRKPRAT